MKVVLDTNIIISSLIFPNPEISGIIKAAQEGRFELFVSDSILNELHAVLIVKFKRARHYGDLVIEELSRLATVISPKEKISRIKADSSDNKILECALGAKANYLVTGDKKHILPLGRIDGCEIVSASEFLKIIGERKCR